MPSSPHFNTEISIGSILTFITIVVACSLSWGKMNGTVDEFKTLRDGDLRRIEKVEVNHEILKEKVSGIEKHNVQLGADIKYIILSIDEIKKLIRDKSDVK